MFGDEPQTAARDERCDLIRTFGARERTDRIDERAAGRESLDDRVEQLALEVGEARDDELAKRYGTAEGAAFANGLLDRALTDLNLRR